MEKWDLPGAAARGFLAAGACSGLPARRQHGRARGSPGVQLCPATSSHPGRLCTYRGATSHAQSCRKASQPFPDHAGCQGPSERSEAEGAQEFRRRMCLLFVFSVIRSGLWLNPVCQVLSLVQEPGAARAWRQAGENPHSASLAPLCPFCLAALAPPAPKGMAPGTCSGTGDGPRSPRACGPSRSPCRLGNRPTAGAEPILTGESPQHRPWDGGKHAGA